MRGISAALPAIGAAVAWVMLASAAPVGTPPPPAVARAEVKPALWKLADADTTIYLFGTIHILPKDFAWRTPQFDQALGASSTLVLEVANLDDEQASTGAFLDMAVSPDLPAVKDRVPDDRRAGLALMMDKAGLSSTVLSRFESWAVALTLGSAGMRDLQLSADYGVERALAADFKQAKKPIIGLETAEQQFGFFDTLPETAQRTLLVSMIDEQGGVKQMFDEMISAWSTGDENRIALTFDDELSLSPELVERLLRQRNRNWAGWLEKRLDQPGTVMVAVGAGHLAGKDSVQALLTKKGMAITRVQ